MPLKCKTSEAGWHPEAARGPGRGPFTKGVRTCNTPTPPVCEQEGFVIKFKSSPKQPACWFWAAEKPCNPENTCHEVRLLWRCHVVRWGRWGLLEGFCGSYSRDELPSALGSSTHVVLAFGAKWKPGLLQKPNWSALAWGAEWQGWWLDWQRWCCSWAVASSKEESFNLCHFTWLSGRMWAEGP